MTTRFLTALALSTALALAGCGGSSRPTSANSRATTPTAASGSTSGSGSRGFVSQLNMLCNRANAAYSSASTGKAQAAVITRYLAKFHSLNAPANLRTLYAHYLSVLGAELNALQHGNASAVGNLAQNVAKPLATRLGATDCANPK